MASKYRTLIANRTLKLLKTILPGGSDLVPTTHQIAQQMKIEKYSHGKFGITIPVFNLLCPDGDFTGNLSKFIREFETDNHICTITDTSTEACVLSNSSHKLQFHFNKNLLVRNIDREISREQYVLFISW